MKIKTGLLEVFYRCRKCESPDIERNVMEYKCKSCGELGYAPQK